MKENLKQSSKRKNLTGISTFSLPEPSIRVAFDPEHPESQSIIAEQYDLAHCWIFAPELQLLDAPDIGNMLYDLSIKLIRSRTANN